jgi:(1->4)-alpha-D-glucan 1-alpha-D-glucosylmutase
MRLFQQLSAPLAAKAVEDTAFYRYGVLSRLDVGFDASCLGDDPAAFHQKALRRFTHFPDGMLATATHDHKRGEDVRARLAALSEIPDEWEHALNGWLARSSPPAGETAPAYGDVALLFQTMVGAWPPDLAPDDREGCAVYGARLWTWWRKALREAKLATDWTNSDEAYETAAQRFLVRLFDASSRAVLCDIAAFASRIAPAGAVNGLAQLVLKATAPGVPDFYQGTEFWDLSLVDPDNRSPVDFVARFHARREKDDIGALARDWANGRVKQAVMERCLALRQEWPTLFARGRYVPLAVDGLLAAHAIAFARMLERTMAITIVPRLPLSLLVRGDGIGIPTTAWRETALRLPELPLSGLRNALTGATVAGYDGVLRLGDVFGPLPVAVLFGASPVGEEGGSQSAE